jgi:hypothetical protein
VNQYWYKEWETKLLEHEEDAEERLFLQPHLGVHTMTPELAASRGRLEARAGARRVMEQDIESWLGAEVLFTFTLTDQASGQLPSPGGPGAWFANALVRDAEVSKRFREEFERLWDEAPDRDHTLHVLRQSIDKISAVT